MMPKKLTLLSLIFITSMSVYGQDILVGQGHKNMGLSYIENQKLKRSMENGEDLNTGFLFLNNQVSNSTYYIKPRIQDIEILKKKQNPSQSPVNNLNDNKTYFNATQFVSSCIPKSEEEIVLAGFMTDFLKKSCKDNKSISSTESYCGCISNISNGRTLGKDSVSKVMEQAFKAQIIKKLNDSIFYSLTNSDIVGYGELSAKNIENKLQKQANSLLSSPSKYSCTPGNISKIVNSLKSSQKINSRCQKILSDNKTEEYSKQFIDKIKRTTPSFNNYYLHGNSNDVNDFAGQIDSIAINSFDYGISNTGANISRISKGTLEGYINKDEANSEMDKIHTKQLELILKLSIPNTVITDELRADFDTIIRTNPFLRKLGSKYNKLNDKYYDANKYVVFSQNVLANLKVPSSVLNRDDNSFFDVSKKLYMNHVEEVAKNENQECLSRFAEIEKMCATDPAELFAGLESDEIAKIIDDVVQVEKIQDSYENYEDMHMTGGLAFCHAKQICSNGKSGADCNIGRVAGNAGSVQSITTLNEVKTGEFRGGSTSIAAAVAQAALSNVPQSPNSTEGTGVVDRADAASSSETYSNQDIATNVDSGFSENEASKIIGQASQVIAGAGSNYLGNTTSNTTLPSSTASLEDSSAKVPSSSPKDPYYEKLLNELNEVKAQLQSSKEEQVTAKSDLENLKKSIDLKAKEDEILAKENKLKNTISSLENKISTLETKEKSVAKEISKSFPTSNSFGTISAGTTNKVSSSNDDARSSSLGGASQIASAAINTAGRSNSSQSTSSSGISSFNTGRLLTLQGEKVSRGSSSSLPIIDMGIDDPKLSSRVIDSQGNTKVIFVKDDDKIYRISPSLDEDGKVKIVNGQPVLIRELASVEQLLGPDSLIDQPQVSSRLPAYVLDDNFVGPVLQNNDPKYKYEMLLKIIDENN